MKISAKTEYACIAMLELAAQYDDGGLVRIREIAERHNVPPRFLVQILLQLKGAGFVTSVRGASGGYRLLAEPDEISLGQVMTAVDGLTDDEGQSSIASPASPAAKVLMQTWKDVATVQRKMLNEITLAELLNRVSQQGEPMYNI